MKNYLNPILLIKKINNWIDRQHWFIQLVSILSFVFIIRTFVFGLYVVPTGSMEPTMLVGESFFADKFTPLFIPIKRGDIISLNDPTFKYSNNKLVKLFQMYVFGPDSWTKRVIGIPGDRVQGKIEEGKPVIYLNGQRLHEAYVNKYPIISVKETAYQLHFKPPFLIKKISKHSRTFDPELPITDSRQPFYNIQEEDILPRSDMPFIQYPNTPLYGGNGLSDIFDVTLAKDEYFILGDNRLGSFDGRGFGRVHRSIIHGKIVFRLFSFDTANSFLYEIITNPIGFFKKARSWNRWFSIVR